MAWEQPYKPGLVCAHVHYQSSQRFMSGSLTKSFSNLTVGLSPPPIPLTVPSNETHGRLMFYGFETTEDWLANYTEKNRTSCNIPSKGRLFDFNYALWILQQRSGIRKLNCTRVLSHNTPIPPRCEKHQKGLPFRNAEATYIISICSSREKSFLRRPNERQVDLLKQIMDGQEPMWWVDYANGV